MNLRLRCLYNLLEANGMLWVHLDDVEVHYCKVLLDEIFARQNFVAHITYERSAVAGLGQGGYLVNTTEHRVQREAQRSRKTLRLRKERCKSLKTVWLNWTSCSSVFMRTWSTVNFPKLVSRCCPMIMSRSRKN